MRFGILGPLLVSHEDGPVAITGRRPRAVLACLLLRRGHTIPDDALIDAVYGDHSPRSARNQIQQAIHHLRKIGVPVTRDESGGYSLAVTENDVDSDSFQLHVQQARTAVREDLLEEAATHFTSGFALWRGEALAGFDTPYFREAAAELEELRLAALAEHVEVQLELGRSHVVIPDLSKAIVDNPLRERYHGQIMLALYREGRQSEALEVFRSLRHRLGEELGVEPAKDLERLHRRILAQDPTLHHSRTAGLQDAVVPRQLPPRTTVLNGREAELRRIRRALTEDRSPVAVLAGFGGIGKTALAVHAAHGIADSYPDGQLFAKLTGEHGHPAHPEDVLGMFLRALGLRDMDLPPGLEERAGRFRTLTAGKRILVVLDDAGSLRQVQPLVPAGDGCALIITTSSWDVSQPGWESIKLTPLAPADARSLLERGVGRDLLEAQPWATREVLDRCGGLPLALEIVAARIINGQGSIRRVAERLADRDRLLHELTIGDRTVRAVLERGYRALGAGPRGLLRKIGLLGCAELTAETAAALEGTSTTDAGYLLDDLADAHFLIPAAVATSGETTYRCLDMVLAFGRERSFSEDDAEARATVLERTCDRLEFVRGQVRRRRPGVSV
ncbi:hypothetical protein G3I24_23315 [Micromonospora aurantiaca]|nr:hypothetical protein [Micromonospora aurantiaca]